MGHFGFATSKSHPGSIFSRVRCVMLFTLTVKCTQVKCRNKVSVILKAHKLFCWLIPSQKSTVRWLILFFGTPSWLHHSSCNFTCLSTVVDPFPSVYFHSCLLFGLSLDVEGFNWSCKALASSCLHSNVVGEDVWPLRYLLLTEGTNFICLHAINIFLSLRRPWAESVLRWG